MLVERLISHAAASSRTAAQPSAVPSAARLAGLRTDSHSAFTSRGRSFWHAAAAHSKECTARVSHRSSTVHPGGSWRGSSYRFSALPSSSLRRGPPLCSKGFASGGSARVWGNAARGAVASARGHATWAGNAAAQAAERMGWNSQAVAAYTPKLPSWVRSRLPEMPEGEPAIPANARMHASQCSISILLRSICSTPYIPC